MQNSVPVRYEFTIRQGAGSVAGRSAMASAITAISDLTAAMDSDRICSRGTARACSVDTSAATAASTSAMQTWMSAESTRDLRNPRHLPWDMSLRPSPFLR
jgi:hypothetical protein